MALFEGGKFFCECGCGREIRPWSTWAPGHNMKSEEARDRIAKVFSEANLGLVHSDERIRHNSEAQYLRFEDLEECDRISEALTGRIFSEEHLQHMSEAQQRRWEDPRERERNSRLKSGLVLSDEHKRNISRGLREYWKGAPPGEGQRRTQPAREAVHRKPNKLESLLDEWLQKDFPGEWKYVGDNQVRIGSRNPDFISTNGRKAVIELFGEYYHNDFDVTSSKSEEGTVEYYSKHGYECLVVWANNFDDLLYEWLTTIEDWIREFEA